MESYEYTAYSIGLLNILAYSDNEVDLAKQIDHQGWKLPFCVKRSELLMTEVKPVEGVVTGIDEDSQEYASLEVYMKYLHDNSETA